MTTVNIATNPINLRLATDWEAKCARETCDEPKPDFVLASDTAFPGQTALYIGVVEDGELTSGGWICNIG